MHLRNVLLLIAVALVVIFIALNWSAIMAPTTLSLAVAQVHAPLGLVMLGLVAVLTTLFLLYVVYLHTTVLMETRRHAREIEAQRERADQAEASRFTELRSFVDTRLNEMENALAAHIAEVRGEVRDRLTR